MSSKLTSCMKLVNSMDEQDQDALLDRLGQYQKDGIKPERAQLMAASDTLAELEAERKEFMAMLREQHPDIFRIKPGEEEDADSKDSSIKKSQARDVTETPEFKAWFGDSKVVDAEGRPLVVYHGGQSDITQFDTSHGAFFAANPGAASAYALGHEDDGENFAPGANVTPAYLSLQNPLVVTDKWLRQFAKRAPKGPHGRGHAFRDDFVDSEVYAREAVFAEARRLGHDGMILPADFLPVESLNGDWEEQPAFVVFRPEQIKSATGNNGNFDPSNPDIRKSSSRAAQEDTPEFKRWSEGLPVHDSFADRSSDRGIFKLYHMTTADFSEFKPGGLNPTDSGPAIWLSADPSATSAAFRVGNAERGFREGARTMPVYAKVKNPLVIDDAGMLDYAREAFADGSREFPQLISKSAAAALKEEGHDSVIFDGPGVGWKGASVEVIVFDGGQVKSITGNSGAFDPASKDIRKSRARNPSEIFGRDIAPVAIKAYKSLSARAKNIIDGWNVNWHMGQDKLRSNEHWDEVVKAYEPVREKMRQVYGDTVPAYRGEKQEDKASGDDRFLFSWTPMRDIAVKFAINRNRGLPPEIAQAKVDEQVENYRKNGIARMNGYKFVRKDPGDFEPDGPDYYYIYQREEMITDGDDIAEALQRDKDERDEWIAELKSGGKLYTAEIPVDSIAFIPVNANLKHPEFVAEHNPRKDAATEIKLSKQRNAMGFYSALAAGIDSMPTKSAPAGAWKAQIKGLVNKGAVKQDEVTWSGLEDWMDLQDGKINKEQIAEYLEQGGVNVEETVLGEQVARGPAALLQVADGRTVKYHQYTLPGGKNYREVLLTLPAKPLPIIWTVGTMAANRGELVDGSVVNDLAFDVAVAQARESGGLGAASQALAQKIASTSGKKSHLVAKRLIDELLRQNVTSAEKRRAAPPTYTSSHWDQPNVIAHIRVNDRVDADGAKTLFVEEVQSDAGQDKRKGKTDWNAPFIDGTQGWLNLALKRIVAMAADGGYSKVAFVNGEQSADRYDLSKSIESIGYDPKTGRLQAYDKSRMSVIDKTGVSEDQLEDYIGKEVAQRLLATEPMMGKHLLDGEQIKVGGEGMKTFYNSIVPQAVKKLISKMDGKLETVGLMNESEGWKITPPDQNVYGKWMVKSSDYNSKGLTFDTEAEAKAALMEKAGALEQPGFAITPKMQEQVSGQGMTLFSRARNPQEDTQEFKDWFGDSKVVDKQGQPLVVYRGEHGTGDGQPQTVLGSITFTDDPQVASTYAEEPNDFRRFPEAESPRVIPAYLSIQSPIINTPDDPFMEFSDVIEAMGQDKAVQFARKHSERIENTGNWLESEDFEGYDTVDDLLDQDPGAVSKLYMDAYALLDDPEFVKAAKDAGFDGAIHAGNGESADAVEYRVFSVEQIKSATGNQGTFDPENPDIRKSTGRTATGADWDSPSASKFDDMVYKLQDKQVDLKRVVEAVKTASGALDDDLNVYLQEELYHGRAAKRTEDFVNMELTPLIERMKADGLEISDVEEFLHARHAPEANKVIAQRNPGVQDLQDGGSGMKTSDALDYMNNLDPAMKAKLEAAADQVDAIIKKTREMYVDYELESKSTVDAWDSMFDHYIPLQREDKEAGPGLGQGFSVKGRETKGRTGSTRKVVDILANVAIQREKAIVRGEKNRVSQALVGLAKANPNEGFWTVDEVPTERVFNPKTGLVEDRVDPLYKSRNNAVIAKIADANGQVKEHAVLFNEEDPRALRMAESLKNLDAADLEGVMGIFAKISRYFAATVTQWNPVFGAVNLVRDVQGVALNLSSTPLKGDEMKVMRRTWSAIAGIYGDLRAARKGKNQNSQWAALWDEFQEVGGQTGYRELFKTSADRGDAIKDALDPDRWTESKLGKIFTAGGLLKVPMAQAKRSAGWIFDWLSDYNDAFENGVRLSVYKAGLERGLSKEQAASIAKNASTNFNRKGQVGQQAGAMYAFFNASVQGTARIGQTLLSMEPGNPKSARLSSTGKKIVAGGLMLGTIQALLLAAAGHDDEDPPQFARERGLIIPIGDKKYITIPMPLGFNVIPNLSRIATEFAMSGFKDPHERALQLFGLVTETFSPIGNSGLSMQTLAPTALDPLVALAENKDWTGKPIARESRNEATPGHALAKDTATTWSKAMSEAINTLSGGTQYTAGVLSPTPDQIDYLLSFLTGGVGKEISKLDQAVTSLAYGEELPPHKIPLAGRFFGNSRSQSSEGSAFYANTRELNELETEIKGLKEDGKHVEAAALRASRSDAYLIAAANQAERQIQRLRSQKRDLIKSDAPRERVKAVEDQITAAMARLNRSVEALEEKSKN